MDAREPRREGMFQNARNAFRSMGKVFRDLLPCDIEYLGMIECFVEGEEGVILQFIRYYPATGLKRRRTMALADFMTNAKAQEFIREHYGPRELQSIRAMAI